MVTAGEAHADPVSNYADHAAYAVCGTLDEVPNFPGILGVLSGVQEDSGFSPYQAGQVVGMAVRDYCPRHLPLLQQFVAVYS